VTVVHFFYGSVLPLMQLLKVCHDRALFWLVGIADMQNKFIPEKVQSFDKSKNWAMVGSGQHHTVALDATGQCFYV